MTTMVAVAGLVICAFLWIGYAWMFAQSKFRTKLAEQQKQTGKIKDEITKAVLLQENKKNKGK